MKMRESAAASQESSLVTNTINSKMTFADLYSKHSIILLQFTVCLKDFLFGFWVAIANIFTLGIYTDIIS